MDRFFLMSSFTDFHKGEVKVVVENVILKISPSYFKAANAVTSELF